MTSHFEPDSRSITPPNIPNGAVSTTRSTSNSSNITGSRLVNMSSRRRGSSHSSIGKQDMKKFSTPNKTRGSTRYQSVQAYHRQIEEDIRSYLRYRQGVILNKGLILKLDKFPVKEAPQHQIPVTISGARNLRQAQFGRIFGAGQPTIAGIYGVLNILRAGRENSFKDNPHVLNMQAYPVFERHNSSMSIISQQSQTPFFEKPKTTRRTEVIWINLREEPILYINNRAVVLRDFEEPFQNLQYFRGIKKDRIEDIEWKLKEDCVKEVKLNGGNLMVHAEDRNGQLNTFWEAVKIDEIKTSKEVFFQFQMEGYRVKYKRLPSTSERPPPKKYFDLLMKYVMHTSVANDTTIVCNCQTGKSRSTFCMVAVCLIQFWRGYTQKSGEEAKLLSVVLSPYNYRKQNLFNPPPKTVGSTGSVSDSEKEKKPKLTPRIRRGNSKMSSKSLLKAALHKQQSKSADTELLQESSNLPPAEESLHLGVQGKQALKSFDNTSVFSQIDELSKVKVQNLPSGKPITRVLSGRTLDSMEKELKMPKSPMMKPLKVKQVLVTDDLPLDALEQEEKRKGLKQKEKRSKLGTDRLSFITDRLLRGWYQPVIDLLRLLDTGLESKSHVDYFIDRCDRLLNIREAIYKFRAKASETQNQQEIDYYVGRAVTELVRYMLLIIFDAYMNEQIQKIFPEASVLDTYEGLASQSSQVFSISFENWLDSRLELRKILAETQNNHEKSLRSPVFLFETDTNEYVSDVVKLRNGQMLNQDSILKIDNFSNFEGQNEKSGVLIKGAVNFRIVTGTGIGGCGSPTISGMVSVVQYLSACTARVQALLEDSSEEDDDSETCNLSKPIGLYWINLREEPIVYINKKPAMLRSMATPFQNARTFHSIEEDRLEKAEQRLKDDIIREAGLCKGKILVHMEEKKFELLPVFEEVNVGKEDATEDVLTAREAYENVSSFSESCNISFFYRRVAMSPEKPPAPGDIDKILAIVEEAEMAKSSFERTFFIYNCQVGKGRSTVASILTFLEVNCSPTRDLYDFNKSERSDIGEIRDAKQGLNTKDLSDYYRVIQEANDMGSADFEGDVGDDPLHPGSNIGGMFLSKNKEPQYNAILALLRVLKNGKTAKKWADLAVQKCGDKENIIVQISKLKDKSTRCRHKERSNVLIERALMYLQRYFMIITAASYILGKKEAIARAAKENTSANTSPSLRDYSSNSRRNSQFLKYGDATFSKSTDITFSEWFHKRKELSTLFETLKDKNALSLQQNQVLSSSPAFEHLEAVHEEEELNYGAKEMDDVLELVASRDGSVLVSGSILKEDHFPGSERLRDYRVEGAPNFRPVFADMPSASKELLEINKLIRTYGVGIPTLKGLENVLDVVHERDNQEKKEKYDIVWINLREEPILYIHGKPYVVRKLEHPFENLEHTGINTERVENMEERLKIDVLNELNNNNGLVLLHGEDDLGLTPGFEKVDVNDALAVLTPRDLYDYMKSKYNLIYYRIPITDEQAPKFLDYDKMIRIVQSTSVHSSSFILNCQMGRGRTTTGNVIVSALRLWQLGILEQAPLVFKEFLKFRTTQNLHINSELSKVEIKYKAGKIKSVTSLLRVIENGSGAKIVLDVLVDLCEKMQNLREAVFEVKQRAEKARTKGAAKQASINNTGREYLKRYAQLIVFLSYLLSVDSTDLGIRILGNQQFDKKSFSAYMFSRKEISKMLNRISFPH